MEFTICGIVAMLVGWGAGRLLKLDDVGVVILMTMAGAGSIIVGLPYLFFADIITGQSASPMWFVVGVVGAILGVIVFLLTRYLDALVKLAKDNGLL